MTKPNVSLRGTLVAALAALASPLATAQFDVGLVAYWPLDGDTLDATATGAHGTFVPGTGDPTERYELAKFGDGIFLNDIVSGAFDQYIEIDGVPEDTFDFAGGSMTVSAWVASPVLTLASQSIVSKGIADTWSLARDGDTSLAPAMTGGLGTTSAAGDPLNPDHFLHPDVPTNDNSVLVHVVGVVEAGIGIRVYVNGQLAGSANGNAQLGNSAFNLWIGANPEADPILELSRTWEGVIDDVAVWSRALSAGEIATIYNNGTGVSIADILNPVDTDGDGMPDFYENTNGLDPNVDDAGGDLDGDGRTNIQEFQDGTNPDNPDTDGDGLSDGEEATAGTNPNATDTDGDRLSDGEEINGTLNPFLGGVRRDPFDPLSDPAGDPTNPLLSDTDDDTFDDKTEIDFQADPNDPADQPSRWQIGLKGYWQLHLDDWTNSDPDPALRTFEDASGRGFPGVLSGTNTATVNSFAGPFGTNVVRFDGVDQRIEITGDPDEFAMAGGEMTVSAWFLTPGWAKTWQAVVAKGEGNNWRLHRNGGNDNLAFTGGAPDVVGGPLVDNFAWHHVVATTANGNEKKLYVDGVLVASGAGSPLAANGKAVMIGGNPDAPGDGHRSLFGAITEVAIWCRPLADSEVRQMWNNGAGATIEDLIIGLDTDGDGMSDLFEDANGLDPDDASGVNGADGDLDGDGRTNKQEHDNNTPPNDPDPDGDGLNDGEEFAAGTDSFNADTDGDGLGDAEEIKDHGTDPLLVDTDGDSFSDRVEIDFETDPTDPASFPTASGGREVAEILVICLRADQLPLGSLDTWRQDGVTTAPGDFTDIAIAVHPSHTGILAGSDPFVEDITAPLGQPSSPVPGTSGGSITVRAVTFTGDDGMIGPNAPVGVTGLNPTRSIEVWAYNDAIPGEECMVSWAERGGPDGSGMQMNYGNHSNFGAVTHWGGGFADCSWTDNTNSVAGAPAAGVWHHLAYTYDGTTTRVYMDGELQNTEVLGAGLVNTHRFDDDGVTPLPFRLAHSREDNGNAGLVASLSLAAVYVHDGVLTDAQILNNYLLGPAPSTDPGLTPILVIGPNALASPTELTINVIDIPSGETFHIRQATDGENFVPLAVPFDFDDTAGFPATITVDQAADPSAQFQIWSGPSIP